MNEGYHRDRAMGRPPEDYCQAVAAVNSDKDLAALTLHELDDSLGEMGRIWHEGGGTDWALYREPAYRDAVDAIIRGLPDHEGTARE